MGIQAGSGKAARDSGGDGTKTTSTWALAGISMLLLALVSCDTPARPRAQTKVPTAAEWQRSTPETAQLLARSFYGPRGVTDQIVMELGDVVVPARRRTRFGNGMISLSFLDARGGRLPAVECGGHLVVEGNPGQPWQLLVENETDIPLEILPSADGLDLETGAPSDLSRRGRIVPPRGETTFSTRAGAEGRAEPLTFSAIVDAGAIHRVHTGGTHGSIVVAVFMQPGQDSFDSRPLLERRQSTLHSQPGSVPMRRYQPMLLPYQYQ